MIYTNEISDFISSFCEEIKHTKDKESKIEELIKFTKEVGCNLFNKTEEDYDKVNRFYWTSFLSKFENKDKIERKIQANYLALCNLIKVIDEVDKK